MSALLAAGTLGFTSCSSEDAALPEETVAPAEATAEVNPTYDGTSVKTQFAFNIPAGAKSGTRMADQVVQESYYFNGIKNIFLASLREEAGNSTAYQSVYRLPSIMETGTKNTGVQKIYENVTIPVGTTHFLFWGESKAEGTKAQVGVLNNNLNLNSTMNNSQVTFSLEKIDPNQTIATDGDFLAGSLNKVIAANVDSKTWWDLDAVTTTTSPAGNQFIVKLMKALCKDGTRWAGSFVAVNNILSDLKASLESIDASQLSDGTAETFNAKGLRAALLTAIIKEQNEIDENVNHTFPENLGLPQGAGTVEYAALSKSFTFVYISTSSLTLSGGAYLDASSLCYPASLNYFVSTPAKANDNKPTTWPSSSALWKTETWTDWYDQVKASTQAIALVNNIQYSVARLDVNVKVANAGSLDDNAEVLEGAAQPAHIPSNLFKVTGVAVGGQPTQADWKVLPKAGDEYKYTIWDNQVNNTNYITTSGTQNFCKTLVLDNNYTGAEGQKHVIVAVEIENGSGTDFCGFNGIIKAGAKFYMIAELIPSDGQGYDASSLNRVFIQDHVTKALFTMKDLKNAYIGVPDLRATDLQLGLSVDLEWETGLSFDIDFK